MDAHAARLQEVLQSLPAKPQRTPAEQSVADEAHQAVRGLRSRFLHLHAERVFDRIAGRSPGYGGLEELAYLAAEAFPGLTPSRRQMAVEAGLCQADKEGWEIDLGIFFHALLAAPHAGTALVNRARTITPGAVALLAELQHADVVETNTVRVERRGDAGHVSVCHTACLNAEDNELVADMELAIDLVLLDDRVRVGVVRGAPMTHPRYAGRRVFSAGINLIHLHAGRISFCNFLLQRELGFVSKIAHGARTHPASSGGLLEKPWLAAVDGFAIGGGCQLLPVFDYVVSAADAYFSLPAAAEGLIPGAAGFRLPGIAGGRFTRQLILAGRRVWASEPEARLLCDEVVDTRDVGAAVDRAVQWLSGSSVVPNRRMIRLAEEPPDQFRAYLAEFARVQSRRLYSPDLLAGLSARVAGLGRHGEREPALPHDPVHTSPMGC